MKRIKELLSIRNYDNKIEIDAEIYNIRVSQMEELWKKQNNFGHWQKPILKYLPL
jgi:hypothetical protein